MPEPSTATKVWATNRWSSSKARRAAFCPAASPSKVKMTSPPSPLPSVFRRSPAEGFESPITRRTIFTCSSPKAVPQVATAVPTPARCAAITSV